MNFKQGIAVALLQTLVTVLMAGAIFAYTWGKAEARLVNLAADVVEHGARILYLERMSPPVINNQIQR